MNNTYWLDAVDGVNSHGRKEWSKYPMDGGIRWVLFDLPKQYHRELGNGIGFRSNRSDAHNHEYCDSLARWLRERINIDHEPCMGAGSYFSRPAYISVVGKRCLVQITYGWDI